ncbi:MAG: aminopeptidase P N-terminal domain-containing protein [Bacteroidales bacterium]
MQKNRFAVFLMTLLMVAGISSKGNESYQGKDRSCQLPQEYISAKEVPDFDAGVFELRRQRLMEKMKGEIAVISATSGNDFIYLTGLTGDRQAIALLDPGSDTPYTLFVLPREPMATLWDGERPGVEGAIEHYGADAAYKIEEFSKKLPLLLKGAGAVSLHRGEVIMQKRISQLAEGFTGSFYKDLEPILHEMRVIKDDWEIAQLKKAIDVTGLSHRRVLQTVEPGQKEYDAQAEIEYVFRKNGLPTGFSSIVGSGPNAAILHYVEKDRTMQDGDLLLMDIGASCNGYVADVTRTIPVNGKFNDEQKELYSLVLKANQEAIKKMVPGRRILDCHHRATEIIVRGLYEIGLITDTTSWWQKRFYIQYRNNHYIGLHVHDAGSYGDLDAPDRDSYILNPEIRGRKIEPGMVMTIEPGIYLLGDRLEHLHGLFGDRATPEELDAFAEKVRPVYEKYAGIGIRIEDDVLITEDGNIVLSENAPKTIEEIEMEMKR